jgi:hypothetical protein
MRIVNPTFGIAAATEETVAEGKVDWTNDPIILFSNNKPNAQPLMEGVRNRLSAIRRVDNVDFTSKPSASRPASPEIINDIVRKYRIAVVGLGD